MCLRTEDQPQLPAALPNMLHAENLAVFHLWGFRPSPLTLPNTHKVHSRRSQQGTGIVLPYIHALVACSPYETSPRSCRRASISRPGSNTKDYSSSSPSKSHGSNTFPSQGEFQLHQLLWHQETPYNHGGFGRKRGQSLCSELTSACAFAGQSLLCSQTPKCTCIVLCTSTIQTEHLWGLNTNHPSVDLANYKMKNDNKLWNLSYHWLHCYLGLRIMAEKMQTKKWTAGSMFGFWF